MPCPRPHRLTTALVAVFAGAFMLSACGNKDKGGATQTAARVNKSEITVHQINFVLEQQPGLKPEQAEAASKQALERLIDQELAMQKAEDLKLDRDPRTVQLLEAARRQVISKAYVDRISAGAEKPSAEAVAQYYEGKPALFKERRVYSLQEIGIEAKPEQVAELRNKLRAAATLNEFVDYLRSSGFRFAGNQAVRPAEQIPLGLLDQLAKVKDGQSVMLTTANGAQVIVVAGSRAEPVTLEKAKPAIEQYLLNDARRKLVEADIKAMRAAAKIEYKGKFQAPVAGGTEAAASAQPAPAAPQPPASTGITAEDIAKGMKLK